MARQLPSPRPHPGPIPKAAPSTNHHHPHPESATAPIKPFATVGFACAGEEAGLVGCAAGEAQLSLDIFDQGKHAHTPECVLSVRQAKAHNPMLPRRHMTLNPYPKLARRQARAKSASSSPTRGSTGRPSRRCTSWTRRACCARRPPRCRARGSCTSGRPARVRRVDDGMGRQAPTLPDRPFLLLTRPSTHSR